MSERPGSAVGGVDGAGAGRYARGMNVHCLEKFAVMAVMAVAACGGGKGDDTDESSGGADSTSAASDSTIGMSSNPTTGGGSTTGGSGEASGDSTSVEMTVAMTATSLDTGDESASETATEGPEPALCPDVCAKADECEVDLGGPQCVKECKDGMEGAEPACVEAGTVVFGCLLGLSCEEFAAAVEGGMFGSCADEVATQVEVCGGGDPGCGEGGGGDVNGEFCEWSRQCDGEPELKMLCDMEMCTCTTGEEMTGSCDADGVCLDIGQLEQKFASCCGF
jgi:hypothetical protein